MIISKVFLFSQYRYLIKINRINHLHRRIAQNLLFKRTFCIGKSEKAISTANEKSEISKDVRPLGEKIKENAKTASYTGVILLGLSVTGVIFYYVFKELFSSNSSNSIYSVALDKCVEDPRVIDALGAPIKGFGEENRRRRRNRVVHVYYERDGINCIRMQFYLRGTRNEATVQLDMKEINGKFEYRYLLVQVNDYTNRVIIIEDNRAETDKKLFDGNAFKLQPSIL